MFIGIPLLAFGIATIVSLRKFMLFPHCVTTIAGCTLVGIAYLIASLSGMPRTVALVITSIYLGFTVSLLGELKSNAREAAAVVAAYARPSDLILITPAWYASSFNYYYCLDNQQSNYPHEARQGTVHFEDFRDRLLDPEPMVRLRARLAQARREGRRIWLISDRDTLSDPDRLRSMLPADVLESDRLPEALPVPTYGHVAYVRSVQLREQLDRLYGSPSTVTVPAAGREGLESLQVLLYDSSKDAARGSLRGGSAQLPPADFESDREHPSGS
jgi:hypothetical protein